MPRSFTCPSPGNVNPLRLTSYQFQIQKLPGLTYFIQSAEVPQINLGFTTQGTSVHDIKIPGETMEFSSLSLEFIVDEELNNWNQIYFWMSGLGYPEGHELYRKYINSSINKNSRKELTKGYSDGALIHLDSANHTKQVFTFIDLFPVSLSGMQMNSTNENNSVATATVTFEYSYYTIDKDIPE